MKKTKPFNPLIYGCRASFSEKVPASMKQKANMIGASLKNEKMQKKHKLHMDTIIQEMKVKDDIEAMVEKQPADNPFIEIIKNRHKCRKSDINKSSFESEIDLQKRKVRMSHKLQEIVKYAELFPTQRPPSARNSIIELIQRKKNKNSLFMKEARKPLKEELLIDFQCDQKLISSHGQEHPATNSKFTARIKEFIKERKSELNTPNDYSLRAFIKEEKKNKYPLAKSTERTENNGIDIRQQNIRKFHRFIKGGEQRNFQEFSDYISLHEVNKNKEEFPIYQRIYRKVEQKLQKVVPEQLTRQSFRNIVYLNESMKRESNMEKKSELKRAMKRLKITF